MVKRLTGKRKRALQEKENWMLLPSSSSRPHFSGQQLAPIEGTRVAIPLSAWREYGYWARPVIAGVEVRNSDSTPRPVPFIPCSRGELTTRHRSVYRSTARPRVAGRRRRRSV